MSSNPAYREARRDFNPRGGYTRGRGRGGFNKPRRYWDNDDYYDKDKDGSRRRHSRSRSRSRSHSRSRSYSRSRSRSPSPTRQRRRTDEFQPKGHSDSGRGPSDPYEPYIPQRPKPQDSVSNWKPAGAALPVVGEYVPHLQANGSRVDLNPFDGPPSAEAIQQLQRMQLQKLQQRTIDDPSITFSGYGFPAPINTTADIQGSQLYSQSAAPGLNLGKQNDPSPDTSHSSKKKKEKRKKKKSRRRSSSSSSSSSDESSGSRRRRKSKRVRDSDDDSSDSSDSEGKKQKEKEDSTSGGGGLTEGQREALMTQKEGYKKKLEILQREIVKLQSKEDELKKTRADIRLVDENLKLQAELKGRTKAVHIVLEKINDVLQVDKSAIDKVSRTPHPVPPPPPIISHQPVKHQEKLVKKESGVLDEVDYIDSGQHWCRLCNVFPETVEKMLDHFHSDAHHDQVEQLGIDDKPWHKRNSAQERNPSSSARKLPFRGMQFFSPVEGWYCRLCNIWMGDHHCATDHLKSVEHNSNYMNFLDGHPDWESKWSSDREKARLRAGLEITKSEPRKSRFADHPPTAIEDNGEENGRSIRVQMRNTIKVDENRSDGDFISKASETTSTKDSGLDEWMGKPQKIALDIIDTQKFAEIVRQKHGNNIKLKDEGRVHEKSTEPSRPSPQIQLKDIRDSRRDDSGGGGERGDRRRYDRNFEMQISSRDNRERDRGFRDSRGGRRRSRSRSRSRSRDRGYHSRRRSRSRSRSRSRERERRDRDRGARDRVETEKFKKLPMIGKMPLYKRPLNSGKEKEKIEDGKDSPALASSEDSSKVFAGFKHLGHQEESNTSITSEKSATGLGLVQDSTSKPGTEGISNEIRHFAMEAASDRGIFIPADSRVTAPDNDLKPPGEKEAPGGTNLPDDLQQALDIIYKGGGKPITIPPPPITTALPIPTGVPPPSTTSYASTTGYPSYMGYEPYQMQSFDGYVPASGFDDMEEVSVPGNVPVDDTVSKEIPIVVESDRIAVSAEPESENVEDDMDDLRMLGIDVDDVAVVRR